MELVMEKAELDVELLVCMVQDGPLGKRISHPLVNEIFYIPEMNSQYNKILAYKKKALDEAWDKQDWASYVNIHEKPWRAEKLYKIMGLVPAKEWWELVAEVWMGSENIWQNKKLWQKMLTFSSGDRNDMMNAAERKVFASLCAKETVTLYRGYSVGKGDKWGFSWTTDKAKALWFAQRFSKKPKVETQEVFTNNIIAYLNGRGEKEVIWIP